MLTKFIILGLPVNNIKVKCYLAKMTKCMWYIFSTVHCTTNVLHLHTKIVLKYWYSFSTDALKPIVLKVYYILVLIY